MGAGAIASCSCLGWASPASSPALIEKREELYAVLKVDVVLPVTSSPSHHSTTIAANTENPKPPMTDNLTLYAGSTGHFGQPLHHLPLKLLKRILLEHQRKKNELLLCQPVSSMESDLTLVVSTTIPYPPIDLHFTNSLLRQRVRVVFDVAKQETAVDNSRSLTLLLCSRCGVSGECTCGWRQQHVILPEMEQHSVLQFIASSLPPLPTQAVPCYHFRFDIICKGNATSFGVQVYRHEVQRPIIECPYTVFKMKIRLGQLRWKITRRYSEFVKLHTRLKILADESMLPHLPPTTWLSATDPSFLFQRRILLENYLKGVFMIDILQDSVSLLVFLGVLSTSYVDHIAMRSYRRQILHLQVLEFYTRPGDLILFNGRAKASMFQRSMTRAEWDHVAIVVPSHEGGNLQLLEATGDGVTLTPLTARLLAYSTFHVRYFVLRKLRTPLLSRAVVNDLLERFTTEVEGLSYGLSIRRILHAGQVDQIRSQESTFFCSELVAEAYKSLGIISNINEAKDFWPGSFSPGDFVDSELSRHGASLSPEIIIDSNILEVATATKHKSQSHTK